MALKVNDVLSADATGPNTAPPVAWSLPGARVGDAVYSVRDSGGTSVAGLFESTISVDDQVQQPVGGPNSHTYSFVLLRPIVTS